VNSKDMEVSAGVLFVVSYLFFAPLGFAAFIDAIEALQDREWHICQRMRFSFILLCEMACAGFAIAGFMQSHEVVEQYPWAPILSSVLSVGTAGIGCINIMTTLRVATVSNCHLIMSCMNLLNGSIFCAVLVTGMFEEMAPILLTCLLAGLHMGILLSWALRLLPVRQSQLNRHPMMRRDRGEWHEVPSRHVSINQGTTDGHTYPVIQESSESSNLQQRLLPESSAPLASSPPNSANAQPHAPFYPHLQHPHVQQQLQAQQGHVSYVIHWPQHQEGQGHNYQPPLLLDRNEQSGQCAR